MPCELCLEPEERTQDGRAKIDGGTGHGSRAGPVGAPAPVWADMFGGHIAGALGADEYIVLTDVDGLLADRDDPGTLLGEISVEETGRLIKENIIQGGMLPKIESCVIAISNGAKAARILNGTKPEQLAAMMTGKKTGTVIKK